MLRRILVFAAVAAFGVGLVAVALGTPPIGAIGSPPVRGATDEAFKVKNQLSELKTKGPIDVVDQTITIQPGGHTGWHSHPGPVLVVVKAGTFTLYDGDDPGCTPHAVNAGSTFVDEGGGHVHIGRNEGTTAVELSATYLLPVGAGPRTDVASPPGNCPF